MLNLLQDLVYNSECIRFYLQKTLQTMNHQHVPKSCMNTSCYIDNRLEVFLNCILIKTHQQYTSILSIKRDAQLTNLTIYSILLKHRSPKNRNVRFSLPSFAGDSLRISTSNPNSFYPGSNNRFVFRFQ